MVFLAPKKLLPLGPPKTHVVEPTEHVDRDGSSTNQNSFGVKKADRPFTSKRTLSPKSSAVFAGPKTSAVPLASTFHLAM